MASEVLSHEGALQVVLTSASGSSAGAGAGPGGDGALTISLVALLLLVILVVSIIARFVALLLVRIFQAAFVRAYRNVSRLWGSFGVWRSGIAVRFNPFLQGTGMGILFFIWIAVFSGAAPLAYP